MLPERVRRERTGRGERSEGSQQQEPATNGHRGGGAHQIRSLQETLGNRGVQELHRRGALDTPLAGAPSVPGTDREAAQAAEPERDAEDGKAPTAPSGGGPLPGGSGTGPAAGGGEARPEAAAEAEPEPAVEPTAEEPEAIAESEAAAEPGEEPAAGAEAAVPVPAGDTAPGSPDEDPGFQAVVEQVETVATRERVHPPAEMTSTEAQAAAEGPENEVESKAAANQVAEMDRAAEVARQQPQLFDREGFKRALSEKIEEVAPRTLEDADEFKESNDLASVKNEVVGRVEREKERSQGPIEETTNEAPDTSAVDPKPVVPLRPPDVGSPPPTIGATRAVPKPKTVTEVSTPFEERSRTLDRTLDAVDVPEEALENSNEPEFVAAVHAKREAQAHASRAPTAYRQHEGGVLSGARTEAETVARAGTDTMHGDRSQLLARVGDLQERTKSEDERKRAEVAANIQRIYDRTRKDVNDRLAELDTAVDDEFERGAEEAREAFEDYVDERMRAYKDDRYGGFGGGALWLKDKLLGLPSEVEEFYLEGRDLYLSEMDEVIDRIVDIVETGLVDAKTIITDGRREVGEYVAGLPESLEAVGQEAASDIQSRFDELERTVESKKNQLIDSLARKYTEKLQEVDARIEELKAANRGLVDRAMDAVVGVVRTIVQLKDMLLGVLSKAVSAVTTIIRDPIGFLGALVAGVEQGLDSFVSNIWTHLQTGLIEWLTGTIAEAGIQLPEQFDLVGIFSLAMQILGLTYENIRARAVNVLGEETVSALEGTFEIFQVMVVEGVAGLWNYVEDKIGDLKALVMDKISELIATQVIEAGIDWILGLLGPVGAFVKACRAIYDMVSFFVERARQVASLVDAVLDSVLAIAQGNLGGAAQLVEGALARSIPVLIGFLASLLGLGDLPDRIRGVVEAIQRPINQAIQWVLERAREAVRTVGSALGIGEEPDVVEGEAADRAVGGTWMIERPEGGHVIRVSSDFQVYRFSEAEQLTGDEALGFLQEELERLESPRPPTYPVEDGRAVGPAGYVPGVKSEEGREASMPSISDIGGHSAYEPGDHRGHLIGDRFYGPAEQGNLVPMHSTLNLSTFKSYENRLADMYEALRSQGRPVLLRMSITPHYPSDGNTRRPESIDASSEIITLATSSATPEVERTTHPGSFVNPSDLVEVVDILSADEAEILAVLRPITRDTHRLVAAIVRVRRPSMDADALQLALAHALGDRLRLFDEILRPRADRFTIG